MASGSSRIVTNKPRSESISDVRKLDAILSSLSPSTPAPASTAAGAPGANETHTQELNGVFLKRVPTTAAGAAVPAYDYHLDNKRDYRVRVAMEFTGANLKVAPGKGAKQISPLAIETVLEKGASGVCAVVTAADGKTDFSFSAEVKVYPDQEDIRVADLEGVKLHTTVTYEDMLTVMTFEAENTRKFDVEVVLDLKGNLVQQSGPMPLTKIVPQGKRVALGSAKSDNEIESSWKWQQVTDGVPTPVVPPGATVSGNRITQTSELKGVTLKQTMTPGDPTLIEFEVVNSRDKKIAVSIDLETDGYVNFRGQPRPLTGEIFANQTAFVGVVEIKGDATVNWKYKEDA